MRVLFAPQAKQELLEARDYYNRQLAGLGSQFKAEVRAAVGRIQAWPLACKIEVADIRRVVLSRFPYKLLYSVEADYIYVIAVAHQHRQPQYWLGRG